MKKSFVLCIAFLLLFLSDASEFISPSQSPLLSPTPEPSNSVDCSIVIFSMLDCLSFLNVGSTDLSPTKTCCGGVETVFDYNPNCLCVGLESSRAMGFDLINSRALALPSICNIHIDPHCDVATSPLASSPIASTVSLLKPPTISPSKPPTISLLKPPTTSPSKSSTTSPSKPPTTSPSKPPSSTSTPKVTTPAPSVTPSLSGVNHSSPAKTVSSPKIAHSPLASTAPSPAIIAPSPSKSETSNLLVSKLFLAGGIVASYAYVLA